MGRLLGRKVLAVFTLSNDSGTSRLDPGLSHAADLSLGPISLKSNFIKEYCEPPANEALGQETKQKTDGIENYYTRDRIDRFVIAIIVFMILTLLIVPIYLLYHLTKGAGSSRSHATCIGVLLIFTLSFSACLSLFTRAKRHEILAAAAA